MKRKTWILLLLIIGLLVILTSSCKKDDNKSNQLPTAIGQNYQGGIIAYFFKSGDPGYVAGEIHGLIAAPSDQSSIAKWGCYGYLISGTSTALGTGKSNTTAIVNGCATAQAACICNNLVLNGYDDWYLPSIGELNILYCNKTTIGGFAYDYYWSSSELHYLYAYRQYFGDGRKDCYFKGLPGNVRAVRSF